MKEKFELQEVLARVPESYDDLISSAMQEKILKHMNDTQEKINAYNKSLARSLAHGAWTEGFLCVPSVLSQDRNRLEEQLRSIHTMFQESGVYLSHSYSSQENEWVFVTKDVAKKEIEYCLQAQIHGR